MSRNFLVFGLPRQMVASALLIASAALCTATAAFAQASPHPEPDARQTYERILPLVRAIPIFDNHGHPGFADDPDVDAMSAPPGNAPLRLRAENPEWVAASRSLFDYPYTDGAPTHLQWLVKRKAELKQENGGTVYFDRILDKLNVETMVANRVAMPAYLDAKRFRWVFFVDSFLFPLNNAELIRKNGDLAVYLPLQEKKLRREIAQAGLTALPENLGAYRALITKVVEANHARGGVGIKFEIAYFRSLHFGDPTEEQAAAVYAKYRSGAAVPTPAEYTLLQDYLFRFLLREAGRLHLPVQIHTAVGIGEYYSVSEGNVLGLENILRDPRYGATTFVLLHGGYPFEGQAIWLTSRQNVYLDSSLMTDYLYPADLKTRLREWLLLYPDKVCFGSDAFPFNEAIGAEESDWLAVESARTALAAALAEMIVHGEVTEPQALALAHGYLHDNCDRIYPKPAR